MLKLLIDDILNYPEGALIVYHFQSIKEANSFRSRMYKLKSEHPKGNNITITRVRTKNHWNVKITKKEVIK